MEHLITHLDGKNYFNINIMKDNLKFKGIVETLVIKKDGTIIKDIGNNVITNAGIAELMALGGSVGSPTAFTYLATGTGSTAATATDTALETEIVANGLERASATVTNETTTFANDTLQFVKSWSVTGTQNVREVGIFNAASSGDMLGRYVYTANIPLESGDTFQITYKVVGARA